MSLRSSRRSGAGIVAQALNPATIPLLDKTRLVKELTDRGLSTVGNKNTLADRLYDYVMNGDVPIDSTQDPREPSTSSAKSKEVTEEQEDVKPVVAKRRKSKAEPQVKREKIDAAELEPEEEDVEPVETKKKRTPRKSGSKVVPEEKPPVEPETKKTSGRRSLRIKTEIVDELEPEPENSSKPAKKTVKTEIHEPDLEKGSLNSPKISKKKSLNEAVEPDSGRTTVDSAKVAKKKAKIEIIEPEQEQTSSPKVAKKTAKIEVETEHEPELEKTTSNFSKNNVQTEGPDEEDPENDGQSEELLTRHSRRSRAVKRNRYSPENAPKRARVSLEAPTMEYEEETDSENDNVVEGTIDLEAVVASGVKIESSVLMNDDVYTASSSDEGSDDELVLQTKEKVEEEKPKKREENIVKKVPKIKPRPILPKNNWKEEWAKKLAEQKASEAAAPLSPTVPATVSRTSSDTPRPVEKKTSSSTSNVAKSILDDLIGDKEVVPIKEKPRASTVRPIISTAAKPTVSIVPKPTIPTTSKLALVPASKPLPSAPQPKVAAPPPPPPPPPPPQPVEVPNRRRSRFDQPPPEFVEMQKQYMMMTMGMPPPPPFAMFPPIIAQPSPPASATPSAVPPPPPPKSNTPILKGAVVPALVKKTSSGTPKEVPPPPPPPKLVKKLSSPPPPPPKKPMTEEEKRLEALLAMERAAKEQKGRTEVLKDWMPLEVIAAGTSSPSLSSPSVDPKSIKLAETIRNTIFNQVEDEEEEEEEQRKEEPKRIEAGREVSTKDPEVVVDEDNDDDNDQDFVIREVCVDVESGRIETVEATEKQTEKELEEEEPEYDPFENTIINQSGDFYEYVPSFLEHEEEVVTSEPTTSLHVETIELDDEEEEDDDIVVLKDSARDLLMRALPVLKSLEKENQSGASGGGGSGGGGAIVQEDPDEAQISKSNEEIERAKEDGEQYFHGEPVMEPDDNELFEIAAGIKPKKKEKKLVEIPEEEKVPSADKIELDYYNADLHVKCAENKIYHVEPFTNDGLALMWGGAKTNFGIKLPLCPSEGETGPVKIGFQIKIEQYQPVLHLPTEFAEKGDFRVGFSLDSSPLILGEYPGTWCISASGKKATRNNFQEFHDSFEENDVITCIMDVTNGTLSYLKNNEPMGVAYDNLDIQTEGNLLFPTICTQNCNVYINLGDCPENEQLEWNVPEDRDWKFITELERTKLVRTAQAPDSKAQCTVLMTVGLPGVGKTSWVRRYLADHQDEQWTLISADRVMDAMRVNGVPRNRLPTLKRHDFLRGMIGKSMARLVMLAPRRRRNYLLDMTNCIQDKRKRKLLVFQDFNRKCVVFVPDEEVHAKRLIQQEHEENEKLDTDAMMQYKAAMSIPTLEADPCEEVLFVDPPPPYEHIAFDRVQKMNFECRAWFNEQGGRRKNANMLGLPPLPPLQNSTGMNISPLALPSRPMISVTTFPSSAVSSCQPSPLEITTATDSEGVSEQNTPVASAIVASDVPSTSRQPPAPQQTTFRERTLSTASSTSMSPAIKRPDPVPEPAVIHVDLTKPPPKMTPKPAPIRKTINIRLSSDTKVTPPMPNFSEPPPNFTKPPPNFGVPPPSLVEPLKIVPPSFGQDYGQKASPIPVLGSPAIRHPAHHLHHQQQQHQQHHQQFGYTMPPPNFSLPPPQLSAPYQWSQQQQQPQQPQAHLYGVPPTPQTTPYSWQQQFGQPPSGQF